MKIYHVLLVSGWTISGKNCSSCTIVEGISNSQVSAMRSFSTMRKPTELE